jgi:hypothetical protein
MRFIPEAVCWGKHVHLGELADDPVTVRWKGGAARQDR